MNNFEIFLELIENNLTTHENHPFNSHPQYYKELIELLKSFPCDELFSSARKRNSFLSKLQLGKKISYNPKTYCQGTSEIMMYLNALQKGLNFTPEKKLKQGGTDVDIQIQTDIATYNIEIKSPEFNSHSQSSGIVIENLFRTTELNCTKGLEKIENITLKKNDDNKICEYLKSAQTKFCTQSSNICNILFVALPIKEIERYFGYITNGYSGLFAPDAPCRILPADSFNKTDVIILSSIVDGHTFLYNIDSSWKLDEYFSLMLLNPFKTIGSEVKKELLDLVPNSTIEFDEYYSAFERQCEIESKKHNDPYLVRDLMPLVFPHFFSKYFSKFWNASI